MYETILLKKCDVRCYLIAALKFSHLANPCFTCKYTFCTSQRTSWVSLCLVVYCKSSWRIHSTDAIRGQGKLPCSVPCTEHLFCFINAWRYLYIDGIQRGNKFVIFRSEDSPQVCRKGSSYACSQISENLLLPYIQEYNLHPFYGFGGLKNQMRIRIARSWAGFWKNGTTVVRAVRKIQYNNLLLYLLFIILYNIYN